jgi:hypothetical protein
VTTSAILFRALPFCSLFDEFISSSKKKVESSDIQFPWRCDNSTPLPQSLSHPSSLWFPYVVVTLPLSHFLLLSSLNSFTFFLGSNKITDLIYDVLGLWFIFISITINISHFSKNSNNILFFQRSDKPSKTSTLWTEIANIYVSKDNCLSNKYTSIVKCKTEHWCRPVSCGVA